MGLALGLVTCVRSLQPDVHMCIAVFISELKSVCAELVTCTMEVIGDAYGQAFEID